MNQSLREKLSFRLKGHMLTQTGHTVLDSKFVDEILLGQLLTIFNEELTSFAEEVRPTLFGPSLTYTQSEIIANDIDTLLAKRLGGE